MFGAFSVPNLLFLSYAKQAFNLRILQDPLARLVRVLEHCLYAVGNHHVHKAGGVDAAQGEE